MSDPITPAGLHHVKDQATDGPHTAVAELRMVAWRLYEQAWFYYQTSLETHDPTYGNLIYTVLAANADGVLARSRRMEKLEAEKAEYSNVLESIAEGATDVWHRSASGDEIHQWLGITEAEWAVYVERRGASGGHDGKD